MNTTQVESIKSLGNASRFVSLLTITRPTMNKKHRENKTPNPYLDKIVKVSRYSFHINVDYSKSVEKRIEKQTGEQSTYEVQDNYFEHIDGCKCIVRNKKDASRHYICGIVTHVQSKYFIEKTPNKLVPINKELLAPFFPPVKTSEFKPEFRTINLENIIRIKSGKVKWSMFDSAVSTKNNQLTTV